MKTAFIYSNGCIENLVDDSLFRAFFRANAWMLVDSPKRADVILVNTCGSDPAKEDDSVERIRVYGEQHPRALLIVCGCLPRINPRRLARVHQGPTFGPRDLDTLPTLLEAGTTLNGLAGNILNSPTYRHSFRWSGPIPYIIAVLTDWLSSLEVRPFFPIRSLWRRVAGFWYDTRMFYVKISTGCLGRCSFCAIKCAKGWPKSKPIEDVVRELQCGLRRGYTEFVLSADDAGSYGRDIGTDLVALLGRLLREEGRYGLHIRYIEPERLIEMFERLKALFKSNRILSICSSVQSGNNRILSLMNKRHTIEQWQSCVDWLNRECPGIRVRTQVIVGFPSESEEEFNDTLELVDSLGLDSVGVYRYADKPNTKASRMTGKVPEAVKKRRQAKLFRKWLINRSVRHGPMAWVFRNRWWGSRGVAASKAQRQKMYSRMPV